MNEIIYQKSYREYRDEVAGALQSAAESFVRIGYLLKVARDTNILAESGYRNMEEFAQSEFGIDKGTASRFIGINDRFSENGNSEQLKTEYRGIGWSKLSIMLQLPDSINEEITADFTRDDIRTIHEELEAEKKITPMEHILDGELPHTEKREDNLYKAVSQLGQDQTEMYAEIHTMLKSHGESGTMTAAVRDVKNIMAKSGEAIYSIRIRGVGRIMLSMKDDRDTVAVINERSGEKEERLWQDVLDAWVGCMNLNACVERSYEDSYGLAFQKPEVAPAQPKEEKKKVIVSAKKQEPKKAQKEKEPEKTQEPVQQSLHEIDKSIPEPNHAEEKEEIEEKRDTPELVEEIPGQVSVEDFPEYMPKPEKISREDYEEKREQYMLAVNTNLTVAMDHSESYQWELTKKDLADAVKFLDRLITLENMEVEDGKAE